MRLVSLPVALARIIAIDLTVVGALEHALQALLCHLNASALLDLHLHHTSRLASQSGKFAVSMASPGFRISFVDRAETSPVVVDGPIVVVMRLSCSDASMLFKPL